MISKLAKIGKNLKMGRDCVIEEGAEIGDNCVLGNFVVISRGNRFATSKSHERIAVGGRHVDPPSSAGPPSNSSTQNLVHWGVNSVPPEKIPVMPHSCRLVPRSSSASPSDSRSFGVANMHFTS